MSGVSNLDKQTAAEITPPPRMLGNSDVRVIMQFAEMMPENAEILEIGPWLGGLTCLLADYGNISVVDRFLWTEANAENYPGIAAPNANFRHVFETNMAIANVPVHIIEADFAEFVWTGGRLDLVVIDAPRDAAGLHACFQAIAPALNQGALIVVKHALNPREFGMGAYLDALIGLGCVAIEPSEQPDWCNIATVRVVGEMEAISGYSDADGLITAAPVSENATDPWYGRRLSMYRIAYLASIDNWPEAYATLSRNPRSSEDLALWDVLEPAMRRTDDPAFEANLAALSEIVWLHNDCGALTRPPVPIGPGVSSRLRAYWCNNEGRDWRAAGLDPFLLGDEAASALIDRLAPSLGDLFGKQVVEVGHGLGAGAIASILAGAESYRGIETGEASGVSEKLAMLYPHCSFVSEDDASPEDIAGATTLIIHGDINAGSALAEAVAQRAKAPRTEVSVIRLVN